MDKYAGYVVITYAVTLVILLGYLLWLGLKLSRRGQDGYGDEL